MKSPITGKEMILKTELTVLPFRKEDFEVVYHYYLCEDSGEQFTNDILDNINQSQVYNQYREKHGIPFPEQLISIREKYKVSPSKMSEILGFGINTYRLYESGDMPSVSNGRLILGLEQPEEFIRQVKASSHLLKEKEYDKLIKRAQEVEYQERENYEDKLFEKRVFYKDLPEALTGFTKPNYQKAYQVIAFLGSEMELYKTKLNKLLFYADFLMYKNFGCSITGNTYRAVSYGPVPTEYGMLYVKLQQDNLIETNFESFENGRHGEKYKAIEPLNLKFFTENELEVLKIIVDKFKETTPTEIVDLSHKESAWKDNIDSKGIVSYQEYAFSLKGI
jgi:uncharacterized phage-associated protein